MAYWLFKTEPDEFSIDDLAGLAGRAEPWNGIRNFQARNLLRDQVAIKDKVFIYHSSCKQVGIAGIGVVSRSAYPEPDQFNPESRYFDPKATLDNPRWFCVDVTFEKKFNRVITLSELKKQPSLANMALFKQSRLSVQPVTEAEWLLICQKAQ